MTQLSAEARRLVRAARAAERTSDSARASVRKALEARLGAGAFGPSTAAPQAAPLVPPPSGSLGAAARGVASGLGAGKLVGATIFTLAVFGAGVMFGRRTAPVAPAPTSETIPMAPGGKSPPKAPGLAVTAAPSAAEDLPPRATHDAPAEPKGTTAVGGGSPVRPVDLPREKDRLPRRTNAARATAVEPDETNASGPAATANGPGPAGTTDPLTAETTLLREAQASMRAGDAAGALHKLDDLAAGYPNGVMREERSAARVLALCAGGRVDEARAEAERFLRETPGSPLAERVRASCGAAGEGARQRR